VNRLKIAFVTNLRAPYRTLQLNEFSKINNINLNVYYTDKPNENRKWRTEKPNGFNEFDLKGYKLLKRYGYINKGLVSLVKSHDLIILGGYEKPTYIILSLLCRLLKKPYILLFDGISSNRLELEEHKLKYLLKDIVISKAKFILGNGTVSKRYFHENFSYPAEKIYNQYLSIDTDCIKTLYKSRDRIKKQYKKMLHIEETEKVLIYSGRLISIKNVEVVIEAISNLQQTNISLLVVGGGELQSYLEKKAKELGVKIRVTGFLEDQLEVFKHYFVADAFILPSLIEPWGLVVNEALTAGLPVIVSERCGCIYDLVIHGENGYIFDPLNVEQLSQYIFELLNLDHETREIYAQKSRSLADEWTFSNSRKSMESLLDKLYA
jgi:L-malate glycosyltransferase